MSNAPEGPDWFQASNGKWYPPTRPKAPEAPWVGPTAWTLFLGGFLLAAMGVARTAAPGGQPNGLMLGVGIVAVLVGLVMLAATGRIVPSSRR